MIEKAYDAGIPVILIDRKINSKKYTAYVGADNYEIGRRGGEYIADRLKGKGRVIEITGLRGSTPAVERHRGMMEALKATRECKWWLLLKPGGSGRKPGRLWIRYWMLIHK